MQKGRCKHVRDESKGGRDISNMREIPSDKGMDQDAQCILV
jgi:hypothetical protein